MNPLTLVKRIQKINEREATLGISEAASWHVKYKDSAYVFVGGIPFELTEGDLLAVFAQYGEIVDVNLVRDKGTGKSKGFAFVAYEDQRSTNLAVDNLNGAQVLGRTIRVDHCSNYKKKEEEDEETARQKREERGVCRAFQKGECTRGASCKFSHDEQRAANTGWGAEEDGRAKWAHDEFKGPQRNGRQPNQSTRMPESAVREGHRASIRDPKFSTGKDESMTRERLHEKLSGEDRAKRDDRNSRRESESYRKEERGSREGGKRSGYERNSSPHQRRTDDNEQISREDRDKRDEKRLREDRDKRDENRSREDRDNRDEKRSRVYKSDIYRKEDRETRARDERPGYDRESSPPRRRDDEDRGHRSRR